MTKGLHVRAAADDEAEDGPGVSNRAMPEEATVMTGGRTRRRALFPEGVPPEGAPDGEGEPGEASSEGEDSEFEDAPRTGRSLAGDVAGSDDTGSDDTDTEGKVFAWNAV